VQVFEGEYVPSRPFRVNAGPVHSYVMMADGSTKYLCEVAAGDTVAVVNGNGGLGGGGGDGAEGAEGAEPVPWRAVAVGRCKTESRPMLLVEFHLESVDRAGTIFLQQAETVRFVAPTETVGGGGGRRKGEGGHWLWRDALR
jgi:3-dehydroquinate synthase II